MLRGYNWGRWGSAVQQDALDHVAQGANCVRIPCRWWGRYASPDVDSRMDSEVGHISPQNLKILDDTIRWASENKLWIVLFLDSDCGQNGTQDEVTMSYCDPTGIWPNGHNFWSDPSQRALFIEVWKFLADRYKNTPYMAMYELLPEPNPPGVGDDEVSTFYAEIMDAITPIDPKTPFLIGPNSVYAINKAATAFIPGRKNVVYTGNLFVYTSAGSYDSNVAGLKERLQHLVDLRSSKRVPIFVQQVGIDTVNDPGLLYQSAVLELLNSWSIGYTWWTYRDGVNPDGKGVMFQDKTNHNKWVTKQPVLDMMGTFFKR
jgi:hypothetical protein